ncbi:MAG: hypothetical protein HUJ68_12830 [Clostridia bacterium]|nr:hypothetical protein [Clostridia bacterium]
MDEESVKKIEDMLNKVTRTEENNEIIERIKQGIEEGNYIEVMKGMNELKIIEEEQREEKKKKEEIIIKEGNNVDNSIYTSQLSNEELERKYIALLLLNPKYIVKFYIQYKDCFFENGDLLNAYKSVLFTEGGAYSPEKAKENFSFAKDTEESFKLKKELMNEYQNHVDELDMEKIYIEISKLFEIRKNYLAIPIKNIQEKIVEIMNYDLYDKMSVEEIKEAVIQVNDTEKFKRAILNSDLTEFLESGENNLRNGLEMPFPIMNSVFKGIRKGETMAFAMPSNAGKSRYTIDVATHVALVHRKKVLIISNEMSEEKMKLCFITTIINNKAIQNLHGYNVSKTEGELLEFKFRADNPKDVEVDENGYVLRKENESQKDFVSRLRKFSTEFNTVTKITDWANKEMQNSIYFINITDHTNDELKKVIMNYYYKEQIEYVFYDTLKTDTANIGIGEELKKTATILSNLAQNFNIFIYSTLQLAESSTLPVNLNVNDLAVSKTVKEVLDTLSLIKQINRDNLADYEYSLNEVDTKFFDLKKFDDPDVRYYACVIDKNRAGAKPTLLFRLNLAYNVWEELGYLRFTQGK